MRFALIVASLVLSGCIDAEVTMDFRDRETAKTSLRLDLARQLYDMTAARQDNFCKDGELTLSSDIASCASSGSIPLADLVEGNQSFGTGGEFDPTKGMTFEDLGEGAYRVTFDFEAALKERSESQPDEMQGVADMFRAAMAGHSIVLRIQAPEILETTGTLLDDGTTAEYVIPVVKFLDNPPDIGPAFVTEFSVKETSCFLGIFCG